ncbi:MAG TPA: sulfatase [Bryobacteraceae bacterium]|jgi:arylsulfatase|nr:sulfatase [Bryobacteraceae bacterium]
MSSQGFTRRAFLKAVAGAGFAGVLRAAPAPPNIVFIFADDLGWGDLGCYGSKLPTPNIDRMAAEGVKFRQFYSANPLCSPSRAALMTGRYPTRVGVQRVLFPNDTIGLPDNETTVGQMLKSAGYRTMCVGKWHLGSQPQFLPTNRGFDEFFGLPYSNDMHPLPLMRNGDTVEKQATLAALTQRYTEEAQNFITRSKDGPFFLYLAHTYPHIPLAASERFRGKSGLGRYGDAVMELDWSVGEILRTIRELGLDDNTLVMFSSDNGPWYQGSPGYLRGRKGSTYEGGVREPLVARFPGRIPAGLVSNGVASTMDILPTLAKLAGAPLPAQPLDGIDIWPLLTGQAESIDRDVLLYFDDWQLQCARWGKWKLHVARYNSDAFEPGPPEGRINLPLIHPELYDMENDPEESYDTAIDNPDVVAKIRARINELLLTFPDVVRSYWRDTQGYPVEDTPADALPVLDKP